MNRRLFAGIFSTAIVAALVTLAGCDSKPQTKRIIFLNNTSAAYWDTYRAGLEKGAEEFKLSDSHLTAVMEVGDGTPQGQIDKLRQFQSQSDVAAVAISAIDAKNDAIAAELQKLQDKGIPVIAVDNDMERTDARSYYIGTENFEAGKVLGQAAKMLLEEKGVDEGSYVAFVGRTGADNAVKRMDGVQEAIAPFTEADRMADEVDRTRSRENVRSAIANHPDAVALIGIWSYNGPAIADVVTEKNVRDKYAVVTFDAEPITVDHMGKGTIDLLVVQNPFEMGRQTARLLAAMVNEDGTVEKEMFPNAGQPDGDIYYTDLKVVVPNAESPIYKRKDEFGKDVQVQTFDEFKGWLDQYGLQGS
ncbi:MAG TPA: substrate-binding domain-containing protein [Pirellulaceae bacterium]|jgi:ribose transport system substrate-binding protein|nr:substrate-binding domain-containing protein [Pirellulaceae bacterium]